MIYLLLRFLMNILYRYSHTYAHYHCVLGHFQYSDNCFIFTILSLSSSFSLVEGYCTHQCPILRLLSVSSLLSIFTFLHFMSIYTCILYLMRERENIHSLHCKNIVSALSLSLLFSSLFFLAFVSILSAVNFFSFSFVGPRQCYDKYNLHLMGIEIKRRSMILSMFL